MDNLSAILSAGVGLIVLWLGRSYIMEHLFTWLKYLLYFLIFDFMFRIVVYAGLLNFTKILGIWFLNIGLFGLLPEASVLFIVNCFIFLMTYEVLSMVIGKHHQPSHQNKSTNDNATK